jgi:GntR family transcriptional repressor for pyruvate dehydrogenase complex
VEAPRSSAVSAVFEPVQPLTTFEETVERLGTAIRLGLLAPGQRLPPERELAEQLGISRSTLRQAITTLVQSGHLSSVRGRRGGTFVVDAPPLAQKAGDRLREDWREIVDQRIVLELGTVVLAAERAEPADIAKLSELVDQMADATEFEVYRRADMLFHLALAEASHAPRVIAQMTEVHGEIADLIAHIPNPPEVLGHSNSEHRQILEALARRDGARAAVVMRAHCEGTEHILEGLRRG